MDGSCDIIDGEDGPIEERQDDSQEEVGGIGELIGGDFSDGDGVIPEDEEVTVARGGGIGAERPDEIFPILSIDIVEGVDVEEDLRDVARDGISGAFVQGSESEFGEVAEVIVGHDERGAVGDFADEALSGDEVECG